MFQFTKELILNSNNFSATPTALSIPGFGNFKSAEVVSCYKNPYVAPVTESLTTTISVTPTSTKVYRLVVTLKRVDSNISLYANDMSYNALQKNYEVTGVSTAADLAAAFVTKINNENNLRGENHLIASSATTALTLTGVNEFQRFVKVEIQEIKEITATSLTGYDSYTTVQDVLSTGSLTKGVIGFGTVAWITRNMRLPTIDTRRYTAINQDELPVAGGQYTQYSIRIKVDRGPIGMGVVGQSASSVTDHIVYVLSTYTGAFDTALGTAGIPVLAAIKGADAFKLTYADSTIVVGDTAIPTVTGANGDIATWNSATTSVATIDSKGVITGVAAGTSVITATDSAGSTATFTIKVIA